jgi:hypothetical protein
MGRPVTDSTVFRVDMSHQEMERMLSELEEWCARWSSVQFWGNLDPRVPPPRYAHASESGAEWILAEAAASWLRNDLGEILGGG